MRSIRSKFIALTLVIITLCSLVLGVVSVRRIAKISHSSAADVMNLLVRESRENIDGILGRIEQSVDILAGDVMSYAAENGLRPVPDDLQELSDYLRPHLLNIGRETDGCIGTYIRYSPEIMSPTAGVFYTMLDGSGSFSEFPCTDISLYEPDDIEHVGWYYIPRDAGKPTWMLPYENENIGVYMISYIIPLQLDGEFIGILGMDIEFSMLEQIVSDIVAYENGYAYLTDDEFNIIYHPMLPKGTSPVQEGIVFNEVYDKFAIDNYNGNLYHYDYNGERRLYTYRTLRNGINLCVTASEAEINKNMNSTISYVIVFAVVTMVIFVVITIVMSNNITKPLKKLTKAARRIAEGELDINIDVHTADEVGVLADTLQKTTDKLNIYVQKMNRLAYLDSLTGAENKTAYDKAVAELNALIDKGCAQFAVAVLDVNDLKKTNDTLGHYYGDMLITNAASLIRCAFTDCPVYRIGGDEFAVLLEGENYAQRDVFRASFDAALEEARSRGGEQSISVACGMAEYLSTDAAFSDVFERADTAMYENKKQMKATHEV